MDLATIQAIAALVNQIGLPATVGVILVIAAWNLMPVLARYIEAKIEVNRAAAASVRAQNGAAIAVNKNTGQIKQNTPPNVGGV